MMTERGGAGLICIKKCGSSTDTLDHGKVRARRQQMMKPVLTMLCLLAIGAAAPASAQRNGAAYVSGGIGVASQEELGRREPEFNLKLVFTLVEGNYVADVSVAVKDAAGKAVLEHLAEGPIFMARLPAGEYVVAATYEGVTRTRKLKVGDRLRTEYFRWPADPALDLPVSRWLEPAEKAGSAKKPPIEQPAAGSVPEVEVIADGVGETAQAGLKAIEGRYNLKLVFTLVEGNYLADVSVAIRDAQGRTVAERVAEGPILMARLPAGTYAVAAAYGGKTVERKVRVGGGLRTEYFRWPSTPGVDFPLPPESGQGAR
jgi:hypothetical protein